MPKKSKRNYKQIALLAVSVLVLSSIGFFSWFLSTTDVRAQKAQYRQMIAFANRQRVEIALLTQARQLEKLKQGFTDPNEKQIRTE